MNQRSLDKKEFQGKNLNQKDLSLDLEDSICGQKTCTFLTLVLLILIACLATSIILGLLVADMSLVLILKREDWLTSALASVVIAGWLLTAVTQKQIPGVSVVVIGLSAVTHWWEPVPFSLDKVLAIILTTLVFWAITFVIFYLICFFIAALDILFERSLIVRILIACSILLGTISGTTITLLFETTEVPLIAKIVAILSSTGFGLALMLSGWWLNHRQNIPWKHPDPLRTLVLTVGSWRGTSFHNLDLSGVSFKRAKLANSNLQAKKFYRTCFQKATGLERARVDSQYLDLENLKVQKLLTDASSQDQDFRGLNLRGAYLQGADMRSFDLTDANLTGADFKGADLSESILIRTQLAGADFQRVDLSNNILIDANLTEADLRQANLRDCTLVRAQVARADFSGAIMTGICIEDWSVSSKTCFRGVRCDYIYRRYQDQQPTDKYPVDRNFEQGEFESLYQEVGNVAELIFKEGVNWRAFAFTLQKLQLEDEGLGLQLKGIEKRGDLWVVKVTHNEHIPTAQVEQQLKANYENLQRQLANKEQQINQLLGIVSKQTEWKWSKANEKSLAQFVSDRTKELLPKLSTSSFDLVQTRDGRLKLVQSIYEQLLNQGIQYAYEKYHPEAETQRIRTPKEVLDTPGEGTCLDLALLFCGLCFGYELLPLLIVIEGHAFAAVSLNHQRREWNGFARERTLFNSTELFRGDENHRELQKLIADGAYVAVECTGFAQTRSFTGSKPEAVGRTPQGTLTFERGIAAGREQLENSGREFQFAIDIAVAHYNWKIEPAALSEQP
ncbi:MAG: pentapeptide repeat-containing protein [Symploca sp. SIO2C1]|nr:pentapeptide repeat-containing protein [Symploca sp. SIO2C1]